MPSRLQAVLFDVEGVIAHPDTGALDRGYDAIWPGLTLDAVEAARDGAALYPLWERYSVGTLSSRAYWRAVVEALGRTADDARLAALAALLARAWWATFDDEVLALADELRARPEPRPRTGILSNSCADHDSALAGFAGRFDVACFSHRVGRRKPNPEAFLGAAAALGVDPAAVLFIDDRERNTRAAAALGMTAVRYVGAAELREALVARGLLGEASVS